MKSLSRRSWLKGVSLSATAAMLSPVTAATLSPTEKTRFNPRTLEDIIKLSSNENPYGPSQNVQEAMRKAFDISCRYPFDYTEELAELIAKREGVTKDHVVITSGSTEGLNLVGLMYGVDGGEILAPQPTFLAMMNYAESWGGSINWVPVDDEMCVDLDTLANRISARSKLIFLCNPNNPTSTLLPAQKVVDFCMEASKKVTVFSDEAYYDYIDEPDYPSMVELVKKDMNVIVSRTFSKVYGMAGLRMGYLIAQPEKAAQIRSNIITYPNVIAVQAAKAALMDDEFYAFSLRKNKEAKSMIYSTLDALDLSYVESQTNFIFFRSGKPIRQLQKDMLKEGVRIGRPFPPFEDWCRISTGTAEEVERFTRGLRKVLG